MKRSLLFSFSLLVQIWSFVLLGQEDGNGSSFIRSIQGTWAYSESGADLWMKVTIKRNKLKAYAAHPNSGRYTAESTFRLREIRLVYKGNKGSKKDYESFAQIVDSDLSDDRIYLRTTEGTKYLIFGKNETRRFFKVQEEFDPWK